MERLTVDRFEGEYAVCEDGERNSFAVKREDLPEGAKEGSVLFFSADGELLLDAEETGRRRERIAKKQRRIFRE